MEYRITFKIEGLDEIMRRRDKMLSAFHQIPVIMLEEVQEAVMIARSMVPVKTGRLQESIQILEWNPDVPSIVAGTHCPYAHFVEFGTVKKHARPYWTPAIWEAYYRIMRRIRAEVLHEGIHG